MGEEVGFLRIFRVWGRGFDFQKKKKKKKKKKKEKKKGHVGKSCRSMGYISKLLQCNITNNIR